MIIDFHTHTFPEKIADRAIEKLSLASHSQPYTHGTESELMKSMAQSQVDLSVVLPVATSPKQVEHINDSSAKINEENEIRRQNGQPQYLSFGCMHPEYTGYKEELSRIVALGMKGIKLHPIYQMIDVDDIRFLRIFDRCAELGLVVTTHAGFDVGFPGIQHCSPEMILNVMREIPSLKLICAHMGGWKCWDGVLDLLAPLTESTPIMIDTSYSHGMIPPRAGDEDHYSDEERTLLDGNQYVRLIKAFGADRVVFGTDSPWGDPALDIHFIESLDLSRTEKEQIFHINAEKLLSF